MRLAEPRLELREARLAKTSVDPRQAPEPSLPEIAFVGRSNVGKSSLLNALTGRRNLARTSRTPGKTQTMNWFAVGDACYLVDLPGYGYARVPEKVRRGWEPMIREYLEGSGMLRGVIALVDGRHPPMESDRRMVAWLAARGIPALVVLTKADRVPRGRRTPRFEEAREALGVDAEQCLWFSAHSGEGRDELTAALVTLLEREP